MGSWERIRAVRPPAPSGAYPGPALVSVTVGMTPKAFSGSVGAVQRAAISSWIDGGAQVILLGDETGTHEAARELGAGHVPRVPLTASGVPTVAGLIATIC